MVLLPGRVLGAVCAQSMRGCTRACTLASVLSLLQRSWLKTRLGQAQQGSAHRSLCAARHLLPSRQYLAPSRCFPPPGRPSTTFCSRGMATGGSGGTATRSSEPHQRRREGVREVVAPAALRHHAARVPACSTLLASCSLSSGSHSPNSPPHPPTHPPARPPNPLTAVRGCPTSWRTATARPARWLCCTWSCAGVWGWRWSRWRWKAAGAWVAAVSTAGERPAGRAACVPAAAAGQQP